MGSILSAIACPHCDCCATQEYKGYGRGVTVKENAKEDLNVIFHRPLSNEEVSEYLNIFQQGDINLHKSYFYIYVDGSFQLLAGNTPIDFLLPFDDYERKMKETNQQVKIILPM